MSNRPTIEDFRRALELDADETMALEEKASRAGLTPGFFKARVLLAKSKGIDPGETVISRETRLEIENRQLRRDLLRAQKQADLVDRITTEVKLLATRTPEPPKWLSKATGPAGHRGVPMTIWSDWHYQETVRLEEVAGLNEFNAEIATTRITRLVDTTIDLCRNHMGASKASYPGIVVALGGDLITGDIHEELTATNDRTTVQAINELTDLIASALARLADEFGRVFVPCVVGNHGRSTKRPTFKGRVYTSYEFIIYKSLERHFRRDERVQFMIPGESDAYFKVYGHRFLLTHGDSLGVKGGDGIIGAIGPITRGAMKVGRSEAAVGRDIDTLILGHWHTYINTPGIIVNGALKGYDEYARLVIRATYQPPIQALWFVHPEHGITAAWPIYLEKSRSTETSNEWLTWQEPI